MIGFLVTILAMATVATALAPFLGAHLARQRSRQSVPLRGGNEDVRA